MTFFAIEPPLDLVVVLCESDTDGMFGVLATSPGGCDRDVALAAKALAEFVIRSTDVLAQRVAASRFILRKIARWGGGQALLILSARERACAAGLSGLASEGCHQDQESGKRGNPEIQKCYTSTHELWGKTSKLLKGRETQTVPAGEPGVAPPYR